MTNDINGAEHLQFEALPNLESDILSIAEAEIRLAEAHLTLDLSTIDRLLHPGYVIVQPGGKIETKSDVLASYKSGSRHWNSAQSDQLDIKVFGDTGIVTGRWRASGQHGEQEFDYAARFLSVWIKTDGRWQNIAYQSTEIGNR